MAQMSKAELLAKVQEEIALEWPLDSEGIAHRRAARVIIISPLQEVYMLRGKDYGQDSHQWWFTVGGGVGANEDLRLGAVRELHEETGLVVDPVRLIGPVLYRESEFQFCLETRRQDEDFYLLHITSEEVQQLASHTATHLTEVEKEVLLERKWFTVAQLVAETLHGIPVYPVILPQMLPQWLEGWDGRTICVKE